MIVRGMQKDWKSAYSLPEVPISQYLARNGSTIVVSNVADQNVGAVRRMRVDTQSNLAVMPRPKKKPRKPSLRVRGQGSLFRRGEVFWMELNWKGQRYRQSLETTDRETALIKLDAEVS